MTPYQKQDPSLAQERLERIVALFRNVGALGIEIAFERSFKMTVGQLFEDRFLLGMNRDDIDVGANQRICQICERIQMPPSLLAGFGEMLGDANHVYFGVERDGQSLLFKVYVEHRDKIEKEIEVTPAPGRSYPLYTGFKWDSFEPSRQAVTRYDWYPSLSASDVMDRVQAMIGAGGPGGLFDIIREVAELALEENATSDIQYLEISEEGNPRRSFDINFYKSGLQIERLFACLSAARQYFALAPERFNSLYTRIRDQRFGHLAGGVDRNSNDFLSIYYGAKRLQGRQLASAVILA